MSEIYFVSKGMPNAIKSGGDIRALKMLKILKKKHNVNVIARSADFGEADVKGIGCVSFLTGSPQTTFQTCVGNKPPDVVILSHWGVANEMIDFVRQISKAKILIDTIDLEFLRLSRKRKYDPLSISEEEVNRVKVKELDVYKKADGIIVASDQDKHELLKQGDFNVMTLPCLYSINNEYKVSDGRNAYIICNWTHEPNIVSTRYLCEKVVPESDVLFYVVGKHPPDVIRGYESTKVTISGAEYELNKFLSKMNILLCPVFYAAGMNSKIGEACAYGIPVVTSSMGATPIGLVHRETAMIADTTEDFIESIREILTDEKLRARLSVQGREFMQKYTVEYWQDSFLDMVG